MIISASRRTDIPAYYSEWFMNRIRAGTCDVPNPVNTAQVATVSLKKQWGTRNCGVGRFYKTLRPLVCTNSPYEQLPQLRKTRIVLVVGVWTTTAGTRHRRVEETRAFSFKEQKKWQFRNKTSFFLLCFTMR